MNKSPESTRRDVEKRSLSPKWGMYTRYVHKIRTDPKYQPYVDKKWKAMKTKIWNDKNKCLTTELEAAQDEIVNCQQNDKRFADSPIILNQLKNMILMGYTTYEIERMLLGKSNTGTHSTELEALIPKMRQIIVDKIKDYLEDIHSHNIEMLFSILYQADLQGDNRSKLQAIDILNKMAGAYTQKVEVKGQEPIVLNFN